MKVLLIEDDVTLSEAIVSFLRKEKYLCEVASDYKLAEEKVNMYEYDCILVDITLPGGNGLEIIRTLKKNYSLAGIIIISAKHSLDDKITGLDIGADDYLTKPFHLAELNARIKSLIRRRNFQGNNEINFQDILIIPERKKVYVNGYAIDLTPKEYLLLEFFVANAQRVISKEAIAEHLWGDHMDVADSYDFIYSQVKNLRKKLSQHSQNQYLHTVYGMGYKFVRD